jgi:hypothetical protein
MITKDQLTQLKHLIIASALLAILMCSFALPEQVYAVDIPALSPKIICFIKTDKDENASTLPNLLLFKLKRQAIVSDYENISAQATTAESINPKRIFTKSSTKASLSARISPTINLLLNRKQCFSVQLVYNSGYTERLGGSSRHLFQTLDQQNPEFNAYRGPPSSQT